MACLIVSTLLTAAVLAVSKQAVPIMGHVIATDYSSYLGTLLVQLGTAIEEHFLVTQNWGMGATIGMVLIVTMFIVMFLTRKRGDKS